MRDTHVRCTNEEVLKLSNKMHILIPTSKTKLMQKDPS